MLRRTFPYVFLLTSLAGAETHSLTLPQALDLAARQNPDVALARLDEQRAEQGIRVAQDPFRPKVFGGSGLAYTYGYPNSIEGNAPSLFEVRTDMALYNRPKSYQVAVSRELARGSQFGAQAKADEVAYRAADLFLTTSQIQRERDTVSQQIPSLQKVVDATIAAINEGNALALDAKRAQVNLAMSQERLDAAKLDSDYFSMMLAIVLGFPATDRVAPVDSDVQLSLMPPTEDNATDIALRNNKELKQMQSNVFAKELDLRSYKSARLPQVNLVAQYALFARYNYINYFQKFQRNNFQIGASVTLPLLIGSASQGIALQDFTDLQKLRIQMDQVRNRILSDTRRSYEQWKKAENIRNLARMQLDLARQELTVLLAQSAEGRTPLRDLEQARLEEGNRWIALYDAEAQVTRAKLAILRETGGLLAAIRTANPAGERPE